MKAIAFLLALVACKGPSASVDGRRGAGPAHYLRYHMEADFERADFVPDRDDALRLRGAATCVHYPWAIYFAERAIYAPPQPCQRGHLARSTAGTPRAWACHSPPYFNDPGPCRGKPLPPLVDARYLAPEQP